MLLLLDNDVIASIGSSLSQANGSLVEGFEGREIISRGEPHGACEALVCVIARSKHDKSPTTSDGESLAAYPLAHHLGFRVIGGWIAFDGTSLVIHRFAFACDAFEFFPQFRRPFACIPRSRVSPWHDRASG